MFNLDLPIIAPLDVRDLLLDLVVDPALAYAQLSRLSATQLAMQALAVAAVLGADDNEILTAWQAQIGGEQ